MSQRLVGRDVSQKHCPRDHAYTSRGQREEAVNLTYEYCSDRTQSIACMSTTDKSKLFASCVFLADHLMAHEHSRAPLPLRARSLSQALLVRSMVDSTQGGENPPKGVPTGSHSYGAVYALRLAGTSAAGRNGLYHGWQCRRFCARRRFYSTPKNVFLFRRPGVRSRVLHEGASLVWSSSFLEAKGNASGLVGVIV